VDVIVESGVRRAPDVASPSPRRLREALTLAAEVAESLRDEARGGELGKVSVVGTEC
jgi:hypothetical protein